MRAARSSSELKTTARPSFSNSLGSAAERFRIAPFGASDPNSATSPPCFDNGSENGLITARSTHAGSLSRTSFNETPATVMQSRCSSGFSSRSTAPTPPAAYKSDMYAAGGVGAVMRELKGLLHLDCMTVAGVSLKEVLDKLPAWVDRAVIKP